MWGDTWGALECNVAEHERIREFFSTYAHPVICTPGDNEWVDCVQPNALAPVQRFLAGTPSSEDLVLLGSGIGLEGGYARRLYADGLTSLGVISPGVFRNGSQSRQ